MIIQVILKDRSPKITEVAHATSFWFCGYLRVTPFRVRNA